MTENKDFNEFPSEIADRVGHLYTSKQKAEARKEKGQYFTSTNIASYMSSFSSKLSESALKILDPGCGSGTLSCSLIEYLVKNNRFLNSIELTCYEIDLQLIRETRKVLTYLKKWLKLQRPELIFRWVIKEKDFIIDNKNELMQSLLLFEKDNNTKYDIVISNPPYFKISKSDKRALIAESIVHGQPNIYSIFMMLSANLLAVNGEMIFITPRSFASGPYFNLFRDLFFAKIKISKVHLFNSRRKAFKRDNVLQENIILKAINQDRSEKDKIEISTSESSDDINKTISRTYLYNELIDIKSRQKILYLPITKKDSDIMKIFNNWDNNLEKSFIRISTGPVVAFRKKEYLSETADSSNKTYYPLLWITNTRPMKLEFPGTRRKKQYIENCNCTQSVLVENKNYVLLRRFSTKDDKSRLIATPYFSELFKESKIGIENHLNYIYKYKGELSKSEVIGLAALLNSTLFDLYFRTFNGNTQVSATELKGIPLPSMEKINSLGINLLNNIDITQDIIDSEINAIILN